MCVVVDCVLSFKGSASVGVLSGVLPCTVSCGFSVFFYVMCFDVQVILFSIFFFSLSWDE